MKRHFLIFAGFLLLASGICYGQIDTASVNLWRIYDGLEYNDGTNSESWFIGDRDLVQDITRKLISRGAIRDLNRNVLPRSIRQRLTSLINEDFVEVMCVRRFDGELQRLVLFSPYDPSVTDSISPIVDKVEMERVLGSLYKTIKAREYPINGTSTRRTTSQQQITYDLYLHLFNPHFMIWQDTQLIPNAGEVSDPKAPRPVRQTRWMVSLFGQSGNDYLSLPSWYMSSMIGGLKVSYINNTQHAIKERDYETFGIWVGYEEAVNFSVPRGETGSSNAIFKDRLLQGSGSKVFVRATWIPEYNYPARGEYIKFAIEGAVGISEKKGYGAGVPDSFYSVRNYLSLRGSLKHLLGIFDVGTGVSWHDLHHIRRTTNPISRVEPSQNNFIPFVEVGISQDESLLQYAISTEFNYNLHGYSYFAVKSRLMLSNWLGVDVRYYNGFGSNLPEWHYDNYIMITPIIRINY
jgi:hypothetical protein